MAVKTAKSSGLKYKTISAVSVTAIAALFLVIVSLVLINTFASRRLQRDYGRPSEASASFKLDENRSRLRAERLAKSLTIPTISWEQGHQETQALLDLHKHLRESFPLVHSTPSVIQVEVINHYSLLYTVKGKKNDDKVLPFLLAAHLDVVPVANGTWKLAEPFDGRIVDDIIYGRGALDDKCSVMGIMEALEFLLENKYEFKRTFFIGFGHDEEISGFEGAGHIAKRLQDSGIDKLDFVLDEGYFVLEDMVEGVDQLVSVIGVTEKGYATLELEVNGSPGHSSIPPKETSIGILSRAVASLESNPHPSMFGYGPEVDFFSYLSPSAKIGHSVIFSNLWLFSPLMKLILERSPVTDAIQRTTTAVTIFKAGYKSNVIPGSAIATVNHRIHPTDSLDHVLEHNRRVIDDDRVRINVVDYFPPTPISPYGPQVAPFSLIARSIQQVFPSSIIAPATSPANTDLRRYVGLSDHLYRICPSVLTPLTREGIHGDDERIAVHHYHDLVQFYVRFMVNADDESVQQRHSSHHSDL